MKVRESLQVPSLNRYRLMSDASRRRVDDFVVYYVTKYVKSRTDGGVPASRYIRNAIIRAFQLVMDSVKAGDPLMPFEEFHRLVASSVRGQDSYEVFVAFENRFEAVPNLTAWTSRFYGLFFSLQFVLALPTDSRIKQHFDEANDARSYLSSEYARQRASKRATSFRYAIRTVANLLSLVITPTGLVDTPSRRDAVFYCFRVAELSGGNLSPAARSLLRTVDTFEGMDMADRFAFLLTGALCAKDEASLVGATQNVMDAYFKGDLPVPASFTLEQGRLAPYRKTRTVVRPYKKHRTKYEREITEEAKAIEARRRAINHKRYKDDKRRAEDAAAGRTMSNELEF